jgi:creatinine amidohydrolase
MSNREALSRPWGEYARSRPHEIAEIMSRHPIAYLPWGAIEWHSYHNPVGLDGYIAEAQCKALARRNGGLVMPVIFAGTDTIKPFKGFKYTFEHSAGLVTALCLEILNQMVEEGFQLIVLISGHAGGGHTDALAAAADQFRVEHPDIGLIVYASFEPIKDRYPMNHAAVGETSLQLSVDPETVDLALVPAGDPPTLDDDGVWGEDPRAASIETGQTIMEYFVDVLSREIQRLNNSTNE